jgi:hypothetical protein
MEGVGREMAIEEVYDMRDGPHPPIAGTPAGGGVIDMLNEEERGFWAGRPFHRDIINRLYTHMNPEHTINRIQDGMNNIAFQLNPQHFFQRMQRFGNMMDRGLEARQEAVITGLRDEAFIREQHIQAVRDAGARVV